MAAITKELVEAAVAEMDRRAYSIQNGYWDFDCCPECGAFITTVMQQKHKQWHFAIFAAQLVMLRALLEPTTGEPGT